MARTGLEKIKGAKLGLFSLLRKERPREKKRAQGQICRRMNAPELRSKGV